MTIMELQAMLANMAKDNYRFGPTPLAVFDAANEYVVLQEKVNELKRYLLTDKFFSPNDYVNVRDVLNRI